MNRIQKALRKLSSKERAAFLAIMDQLKKDYRKIPHLKPLVGYKDWYRVRLGRYRILFKVDAGHVEIRRLTKRDDRTYKGLD